MDEKYKIKKLKKIIMDKEVTIDNLLSVIRTMSIDNKKLKDEIVRLIKEDKCPVCGMLFHTYIDEELLKDK